MGDHAAATKGKISIRILSWTISGQNTVIVEFVVNSQNKGQLEYGILKSTSTAIRPIDG